jgi:hypothetical protein
MARQIGIIKVKGTIGDLNFYDSKFGPLVRKAGGGFNSKAIKTKPSMIRVRENASEFGRVAKVKQLFRMGLEPFLHSCKDTTRHGRMMRILQEIKVYDSVSERGKRDVALGLATPMGNKLWKDFELTERSPTTLLPGIYTIDEVTHALTLSGLKLHSVVFPKGATWVEVQYGVLELDFNALTFVLHQSTPIFLAKDFQDTSITMPLLSSSFGGGTLFPVVGVRFYQEVGGEKYLFKEVVWQGVRFL